MSRVMSNKKDDVYYCYYVNGDGSKIPSGYWKIKESTKTFKLRLCEGRSKGILEGTRSMTINKGGVVGSRRLSKHVIRDWGDGSYTVYPNRAGIPYVFTRMDDTIPFMV